MEDQDYEINFKINTCLIKYNNNIIKHIKFESLYKCEKLFSSFTWIKFDSIVTYIKIQY